MSDKDEIIEYLFFLLELTENELQVARNNFMKIKYHEPMDFIELIRAEERKKAVDRVFHDLKKILYKW